MQQTVIGTGKAGFTAEGLDLLCDEVLGQLSLPEDVDVAVEVPAFAVLASGCLDGFMERNQIDVNEFAGLSDPQIARIFLDGELPRGFKDELGSVVEAMEGPLAVRPSSVLESTLERSFGGVYLAKLIPNNDDDMGRRRRQLADAVKLVWASTFFADAVNSRLGAGHSVASERMAVVVQKAVGAEFGGRFYPSVSVVARSYNHYPAPGNEPNEGGVTLALGFGRVISEGHAWSYCPDRPTAPPPFKSTGDLLKYSQTAFWALDTESGVIPDGHQEPEHMIRLGLADAERDGTLALLASTYDAQSDRLRSGIDGDGARVLTFAPLLASRVIPFTSVIRNVLERARAVTGREVEIEMAVTLDPAAGVPVRFGLVQLKTMAGRTEDERLRSEDLAADGVLVASEDCLGDGVRVDLADVVYLKPAAFDRNQTRTIASELEAVNRGLLEEGRSAIFIGFGRWGTTDDRYGVPIRWGQISSARVIVEISLEEAPLNLSQGTHFFHHILSQQVLYLSLEHDAESAVDFDWLDRNEAEWDGRYVRHVHLDAPVEVNVDGATRRGVIRHVPD